MVVDTLNLRNGNIDMPIDSLDNKMIDEIVVEGQKFHFAKQKDVTGTSEIVADNGVDEPIRSLSVSGATLQSGTPTPDAPIPIQNANDNGMSVALHGKNLATAQQVYPSKPTIVTYGGRDCIFADGYTQFRLPNGFKEKTRYTVSFDVATPLHNSDESGGPMVFFVKYKNLSTNWSRDALVVSKTSDDFQRVTFTTLANQTIDYIGPYTNTNRYWRYVDINSFQFEEGTVATPYEPYFRETVEIPTSIDVNGTSVPLLFSEYDKLTVDRINNEVIYHRKSVLMSFTGQESQWSLKQTGYYQIFPELFPPYWSPVFDKGYCTHFKKYAWNPFYNNNGFAVAGAFIFRTNGAQTLAEFKAFLQEQYANGTPVTILYGRGGLAIEHDITNTDLGQSLLALATRKGTNYLEISSNLAPSQTDLSYWRQIIPNE